MKYLTAQQIRETWIDFFKSKGHRQEPSASLIPVNDPTLLWINAGVAPLKKYFDGSLTPKSPRIVNVQKCIRTNDIDNVGKTARHHTFFEMLGNFSIGDYFKETAIEYGFELLTSEKWFGMDKDKLYITYYPTDTLAKETWIKCGIKPEHLIAVEGNFWEIGPGPSGPCTEIFFDRGIKYGNFGPEVIKDDIENDRYIEIWNIVFSQYNANPEISRSQYKELPSKNIDTGAGLERFACVLQGVDTNFETDLFYPIIKKTEELSNIKYNGQMSFKVIADHIKTLTFAISDGAILSNEGRGYVLRRLLRRAVKYGRTLGLNQPFLQQLVDVVVEMMAPFYPNLLTTSQIVKTIVTKEEAKFFETIADGEKHLISEIKDGMLSKQAAFKLYDTYGFPIELTLEYALENKIGVDIEGFYEELEKQKQRSRDARNVSATMNSQDEGFLNFKLESQFVGYDTLQQEATVIAVFQNGIVLDKTPFYPTMGGQVCDSGTINGIVVTNVVKLPNGQHLHYVDEQFNVGDEVLAIVDQSMRNMTNKNHTATHLLHQALKDVLGSHVNQQGSLVDPQILRFDFNHYQTINNEQILKIQEIVNQKIKDNLAVTISQMAIADAKALGAMALFGEKYGDVVRVVNINNYSIELCGGTHVVNTGQIKNFAIALIEGVGSGIYRIEAVTNQEADGLAPYLANTVTNINQLITKANSQDSSFIAKVLPQLTNSYQDIINYRNYLENLKLEVKELQKQQARKQANQIIANASQYIPSNPTLKELIVTHNLPNMILKQLVDVIYDKIKAETIILINIADEKTTFICRSSLNNANALIKQLSSLTNGSGGGNPQFAQGGTTDNSNLDNALALIKEQL